MPTLRERLFLYGPASLSPLELWSLALDASPAELPSPQVYQLLTQVIKHEGWFRLTQASLPELLTAGFSQHQATCVVVTSELSRRLALFEGDLLPQITTGDDAVRLLQPLMSHLTQEVMRVLVLNAKNQVVENSEVYRGTALGIPIRLAEILRPAILRNCPAILVAHFHPSGDPDPSPEDMKTTKQLRKAARLLDIDLIDHLILGQSRAVSLRSLMNW